MSGIRRSAALAAALSFIVPGLGQGFSGALARGALLATPDRRARRAAALVLLGQAGSPLRPASSTRGRAGALVVLDAVLLLYRLAAIVDAYLVQRRRHPVDSTSRAPRRVGGVLVALLAATLTMHAALGVVGMKTYIGRFSSSSSPWPQGGLGEVPPVAASESGACGRSVADTGPDTGAVRSLEGRRPAQPPPRRRRCGPGPMELRTDTMLLAQRRRRDGNAAIFGIPA